MQIPVGDGIHEVYDLARVILGELKMSFARVNPESLRIESLESELGYVGKDRFHRCDSLYAGTALEASDKFYPAGLKKRQSI